MQIADFGLSQTLASYYKHRGGGEDGKGTSADVADEGGGEGDGLRLIAGTPNYFAPELVR